MIPSQRAVIETHVLSPHVNFPSSQKNFALLLTTLRRSVISSMAEKICFMIDFVIQAQHLRREEKGERANWLGQG